jgi:hypothetical protein
MRYAGALRMCAVLVLCAVALAVVSTAQAGDEEELIDAGKTVASLQKKMDELRERGRHARKGQLSLRAVCRDDEASSAFASWGDFASYVLAPEGDLESSSGWELNKHAALSAQNSPFSTGTTSLFLGGKGEAISPAMCISVLHPTFRFFLLSIAGWDSQGGRPGRLCRHA